MDTHRLQIIRERAGFRSARQAALALGIAYTTYLGYEKGSRKPDHDTLVRLAAFFDVTTDYLLGRGGADMVILSGEKLPANLRDREIEAVGVLERSVGEGGLSAETVSQLLTILHRDARRKARLCQAVPASPADSIH